MLLHIIAYYPLRFAGREETSERREKLQTSIDFISSLLCVQKIE